MREELQDLRVLLVRLEELVFLERQACRENEVSLDFRVHRASLESEDFLGISQR